MRVYDFLLTIDYQVYLDFLVAGARNQLDLLLTG
jgi:hypothetical protein